MATPISETPILSGNDARVFVEKMKENEHSSVSDPTKNRMRENYARMEKIVKCDKNDR